MVSETGQVVSVGDAASFGDLSGQRLATRIVGIAAKPGGQGFILAGADGGVFTFGGARYFGSMGGARLRRPIVGIAFTPTGNGYWLVAADGGIFTFGDAHFYGSTGALRLAAPIVGMAATPTGHGYLLVAADGGVFRFGDAVYRGSAVRLRGGARIVGIAMTRTGLGYWIVADNGGVFSFGDAPFFGSARGRAVGSIAGIATSAKGGGYIVFTNLGQALGFGDGPQCRSADFIPGIGAPRLGLGGGVPLLDVELPAPAPLIGLSTGIAIPFDPFSVPSERGGSCGGLSNAFTATSPWRIDVTKDSSGFPYCQIVVTRGNIGANLQDAVLEQLTPEGNATIEMRASQMQGNASFRIGAFGACIAVARNGNGGTQPFPFTTTSGGDTHPFTKASAITVTVNSLQPCQVEVFANSDGHFVDGHFGSHANLSIAAGTYFLRSDPDCKVSVS
jgi:hypothetical protein